MSVSLLMLLLIATIIIVLICILKYKMNPAIALVLGALFMGISSGYGSVKTIDAITSGFAGTMKGIGLSVGFGIMLGQMLADTGAVQSIANTIIRFFGKKRADKALGLTGFIVSIPVFYDVGYVILMPLARALAKGNKIIPYFIGSIVAGLGIAHTFIPPTPGPLTGSELLGIDLGFTIFAGIIIGLPTFILTLIIYDKFFLSRKNFWKPETDEEYNIINEAEKERLEQELIKAGDKLPPFLLSIVPILLPIVLILTGTTATAVMGKGNVPEFISFISDKNIAMLLGLFSTFILARGILDRNEIEKSINMALSSAGIVLLITGTGGGLGKVLEVVGTGDALLSVIQSINIHPVLFTWLVALLLKAAQGSGTVAMITTVSLIAPTMANISTPPVLIAMAAFSGTLGAAHVNDSAFWITTKLSGLSTTGGLKTYTLVCFIEAVVSLAIIMALCAVF